MYLEEAHSVSSLGKTAHSVVFELLTSFGEHFPSAGPFAREMLALLVPVNPPHSLSRQGLPCPL